MAHEAIIKVGDTSAEAMIEKASFVLDLMETRLHGLGADWSGVTAVNIYTVHALERILPDVILKRIGTAGTLGVRWFSADRQSWGLSLRWTCVASVTRITINEPCLQDILPPLESTSTTSPRCRASYD